MRGVQGVNRSRLRVSRQRAVLADARGTGHGQGDSRAHLHTRTMWHCLKGLGEWPSRRRTVRGQRSTDDGFLMLDVLMASSLFAVVILAAG